MVYQEQERVIEAELLYKRALVLHEKVFGPGHLELASVLEAYAGFLRKTDRLADAQKLLERAKGIRAEYPQETPSR